MAISRYSKRDGVSRGNRNITNRGLCIKGYHGFIQQVVGSILREEFFIVKGHDVMKNRKLARILQSIAALFLFLVAILRFLLHGFADLSGWGWLFLGLIFMALVLIGLHKPAD